MNTFSPDFWDKTQSQITFIPSSALPVDLPITAVKGFVIQKDKVLLTQVQRGWDLPTGHVEVGETPEEAFLRETFEETGAEVRDYILLGYMRLVQIIQNEQNKQYPELSGIAVFASSDFVLRDFIPNSEACARKLVEANQLEQMHHHWTGMMNDILIFARVTLGVESV